MASYEPVGLLDLPFEVRSNILSYLLPDTRFIVHEAKTDGFKRFGDRFVPDHRLGLAPVPHWWTFDYKTVSPYPEVLLTNRQLYADGFCQLYELQSFKLIVNYLEYDFIGVTYYHFDGLLPPLPYHAMKEFVIEIWGYSTISTLALRRKLVGLLALFRENKTRFRKLRIQFPEPWEIEGRTGQWDSTWDAANPKTGKPGPDDHDQYKALTSEAPSTFAWVLCAFAMCPGLADECVIELPESLRGKPHMEASAKRYAEGLEGRVPFVIGEEWCLKYDLEDWCDRTQTWSGPTSDCGCENCERYGRWMDGKETYVCCA